MKKRNHPHKKTVHFIGIGGIGVSALARYFLSEGHKISGSDAFRSEITDELKKEGVKILIGHKPSNISKPASRRIDLIIHSAAVNKNNLEVKKADEFGIPLKSYAQALGELTKQYKTIAVAGTCGKSTTTAMLSLVFAKAGLDPTVIIGTKLKEFGPPAGGSNFRKGKSDYLIIEADEHFKSFLNYSPFAAIITNIDRDHLDFYKNLNNLKKSFLDFIGNIRSGGVLVVNKDDKNLFSLKNKIQKIAKKNKLKVYWYSLRHPMSQILIKNNFKTSDVQKLKNIIRVPGKHNISNAMAVYAMAKVFSIKDNIILKALSEYKGAWRRMEYRGNLELGIKNKNIIHNSQPKAGPPRAEKFIIPVYDDYAHHPSKIKAALAGFREKYPKSQIICVFQPHQIQRLKYLFKEFAGSFNDTDNLILLDVYKVKGRDPAPEQARYGASESPSEINSQKLAKAIKKKKNSPNVLYLKPTNQQANNLKKEIKKILQTTNYKLQTIIVMMGAGDIYKMTDKLVK